MWERRRSVAQRLMRPLPIVKMEVVPQVDDRLRYIAIVLQVDFFVLHAAPESLYENVVHGATTPVHADSNFFS